MNDEQSAQLLATLHEIQSVNDGVKRISEIVGSLENVGVS
jgi:hypothetical protein